MATLRDAQTSEFLADGTPLEMVALADELGRDEVLFDNVGLGFDPDAVLTAHHDQVKGLKAAEADKASIAAAQAEPDRGRKQAPAAKKAMQAARARVK